LISSPVKAPGSSGGSLAVEPCALKFAILQDMIWHCRSKTSIVNKPAFFTNETRSRSAAVSADPGASSKPTAHWCKTFPIKLSPRRCVNSGFPSIRAFTATNRPPIKISPGDLISNRGRVVKRNIDLVGRLGVMPIAPDLGLTLCS
jgi:hypothetical protein